MGYPRRFGKYVLIAPLAKGGMGELHLAFSGRDDLKKLCVIKTILSDLADDEFVARFLDEAAVVVKLSHGNLIPVFEAGQADEELFLAMEFIEGKDLRELWTCLVQNKKPFPLPVLLFVIREICRGLSYVHTFGNLKLVHRDVSPPNVMLSYTGEVRLMDFGVATSAIKLQKTAPGILLGKLAYMSPEQARNEKVDGRADIFSLGVILWELLTGHRFASNEGEQVDRYLMTVNPRIVPPSTLNPDIPPALDLITLRALAPEKNKRYPDALAFRKDINALLADIAPAADANLVQELLQELYGQIIDKERKQRGELLETMAVQARDLLGDQVEPLRKSEKKTRVITKKQSSEKGAFSSQSNKIAIIPGTMLDERYLIDKLLGEGGMGRVYLATHVDIGKEVAIKVLHPHYSRMPDLVSRFRHEARAASRIGNPHIVEVYDSGSTPDGSIYFVMEKLTGIDLADVLAYEGRQDFERSVGIAIQISEAVGAAHNVGIVHRDLKPENIFLVTREGVPDFVKVLDFGLAHSHDLDDSNRDRFTNPGVAIGTPEYMAPEQAKGKAIDHRADIYSLGTILYELIVGTPPHSGDSVVEILQKKAVEPIIEPGFVRRTIPKDLNRLIMWMLEQKPNARPQTMAQVGYELTKVYRGRPDAVASLLGIPEASRIRQGSSTFTALEPTEDLKPTPPARARRLPFGLHNNLAVALTFVMVVLGLLFAVFLAKLLKTRPVTSLASTSRQQLKSNSRHGADAPSLAVEARRHLKQSNIAKPLSSRSNKSGESLVARDLARDSLSARAPDPVHPRNKSTKVALIAEGRNHLRNGRFDQARQAFLAALSKQYQREGALLGLAEVEFQLGRFDQAERYAEKAMAAGGGWHAQLMLANVLFKRKKMQKAIELYKRVLERHPGMLEAKRNLEAAKRRSGI